MTITSHAIERFQERITFESKEVICSFITRDIQKSILKYCINNKEKRCADGVIYVVEVSDPSNPIVLTLYLEEEI